MLLLNQIEQVLGSIGLLIVCIFLFVGTYLLNKRTKKPDGCIDTSQYCEGCSLTECSHHPEKTKEEGEEK
jgi:hypothetical protein